MKRLEPGDWVVTPDGSLLEVEAIDWEAGEVTCVLSDDPDPATYGLEELLPVYGEPGSAEWDRNADRAQKAAEDAGRRYRLNEAMRTGGQEAYEKALAQEEAYEALLADMAGGR